MQEILNWFKNNAVNSLISLLIFICGVFVGVLILSFVLRFLKNGKVKTSKKSTVDIEGFVDEVVEDYLQQKVKLGEEKLSQLLSVATKLFEEIPKNYQKNVKYFEVVKAKNSKYLQSDLKISLDFTVYEGLRFLRATVNALQEEIYLVLDNGVVKVAYGVGKIVNFFKKTADVTKKPEDFLISDALTIFEDWFKPNKTHEKKGFVKKLVGKVANEFGSSAVDGYLKDFIREIAQLINLLYSDGFKDEKEQNVPQSTSIKEVV